MKYILVSLIALLPLTGCTTIRDLLEPLTAVTPHNYQDPLNPSLVSLQQLHDHVDIVETHYQTYSQVEGIVWQPFRSATNLPDPDTYGSGGDSCLFTGQKFAADVYRYRVTGKLEDLDRALQSLRGLYILANITGSPGVVARCAFPASQPDKWNYPTYWQHRIDKGFVNKGPANIPDPFNAGANLPEMIYYTRTTKDQYTGLLHGLAVGWKHLKPAHVLHAGKVAQAKQTIANITEDVYNQLRLHDFRIRDENGRNDTNADTVKGLLKLTLLAVYKETVHLTTPGRADRIKGKYEDQFKWGFFTPEDLSIVYIFTNYSQYYAWNLRHLRGYTVYILESDGARKRTIRSWFNRRVWPLVKDHRNAQFTYIYNAVTEEGRNLSDAGLSMRSLSIKPIRHIGSPLAGDERKPSLPQVLNKDWSRFVLAPHLRKPTSYSTWQKEPWDSGKEKPGELLPGSATGIDYVLPYWMARFYNLLK